MARRRSASVSRSIPAPVWGWNARDPLDGMDPRYAVQLLNVFPEPTLVRPRRGFREHATGMGSGAVETVAELSTENGTRRLLACANGNIYNATTQGASATSLGSGFSNNRWQTVCYKNQIVFVNGADQPKRWDGTTFQDATYTGIADDSVLINVSLFRNRLYFVEKDSLSFWYVSTAGGLVGALTEYDISEFCHLGGQLFFAGSWSRDSGSGLEDFFVAMTSMGEALVYTGSYPGGADWALVGRYTLPAPLSRRAVANVGSDLVVLTQDGAIPMSSVLDGADGSGSYTKITDKINNAFNEAAQLYGSNYGWEVLGYRRGHYVLINVPAVEGGDTRQFVMNTLHGAWCEFDGQDAASWCTHNEKLYFGGMNGKVYEADYGVLDGTAPIEIRIDHAYNYFSDRERQKLFSAVRPLMAGTTDLSFNVYMNVDFTDVPTPDTIGVSSGTSTPWGSAWGSMWSSGSATQLRDWYSVGALGRAGSLVLRSRLDGAQFQLSASNLIYEPGEYL